MVELVAAKVVRIDVTHVVLTLAVDQDQSVISPHATNTDATLAGFVSSFTHIDTLYFTHCIQQSDIGFFVQLFTGDYGDGCRCICEFLLDTSGTDHHGIQLDGFFRMDGCRDGGTQGDCSSAVM